MTDRLKNSKIFVVGGDECYANWMLGTPVYTIEESDLVVFTGGSDVNPMFYGEATHRLTYSNPKRDISEKLIFEKAVALKKKIIGICRGSQFVCVMAGGQLIQHQDNPLAIHDIQTIDNVTIPITSTHHQAQYPYNLPDGEYTILAWTKGISKFHEDAEETNLHLPDDKEIEIAYYPLVDALAIQGHPEMIFGREKYNVSIEYLQTLLNKHMWGILKRRYAPNNLKIAYLNGQ